MSIPALALLTVFNAGLALFAARTGARINDFAQLLPFLMRTWLYVSGVIYSIQIFVAAHSYNHAWATTLLQLNPAAIYITLVRNALLAKQRASAFGAMHYNAAKCTAWTFQSAVKKPPAISENLWHAARKLDLTAGLHPLDEYGSAYCHATFVSSHLWLLGAGWAVVAILLGFWYFWRKEVFYGRG